jgi:hypothetical protein
MFKVFFFFSGQENDLDAENEILNFGITVEEVKTSIF